MALFQHVHSNQDFKPRLRNLTQYWIELGFRNADHNRSRVEDDAWSGLALIILELKPDPDVARWLKLAPTCDYHFDGRPAFYSQGMCQTTTYNRAARTCIDQSITANRVNFRPVGDRIYLGK